MVNENISNNLLAALQQQLKADRAEAYARLMLYLHNPSGVANHPALITELSQALSDYADAEMRLNALERIFDPSATPEE